MPWGRRQDGGVMPQCQEEGAQPGCPPLFPWALVSVPFPLALGFVLKVQGRELVLAVWAAPRGLGQGRKGFPHPYSLEPPSAPGLLIPVQKSCAEDLFLLEDHLWHELGLAMRVHEQPGARQSSVSPHLVSKNI